MTSTAAPARPIADVEGRLRGPRSPIAWLLAPAPAARLAGLRILVGAYATAWAAIRLPAHLWHADQVADRWHAVGVLAPLGSPPADVAIVLLAAAAPVLGLLFVAGWRYGAVGPLFAVAMLVLATLDSAWGQVFHTENLVVLHLLILAAAPAADVLAVGRPRPRPAHATGADDRAHHEDLDDPGKPTGPDGRYGWPVRLAAVAVVLAYVLAGIAKLRIGGLDWLDGDTLRHLVANDNLRKALLGDSYSPIGTHMVGQAWLFPPLAVVTVVVELGAVLALRGGRWRTAWVAAAWLFHAGVLALMAIVFPYQLAGVAFAPFFRLERLADRYAGRATGRPRARRSCWGPVSRACGAG
jgi:hypothetical protein